MSLSPLAGEGKGEWAGRPRQLTARPPAPRHLGVRAAPHAPETRYKRAMPAPVLPSLPSILVANRGEIALRIFRTARRLGMRCIAVHSDADAEAPFVRFADEAYRIGPAPARESYLRADAIIDVARLSGAACIHPGYGFLSENTAFAAMCAQEASFSSARRLRPSRPWA